MLQRILRIRNEFGMVALLKTALVGVGMLVMSIAGIYVFGRLDILLITIAITLAAFFCRGQIAGQVERLPGIFKLGLLVYGAILFFGDFLRISDSWTLFIITVTTALVFNMQYWALSDSRVYNASNE